MGKGESGYSVEIGRCPNRGLCPRLGRMRTIKTGSKRGFFQILHGTRSVQAAMSTLRKRQATSEHPENEHPGSEQWVYVVKGRGVAVVGQRRVALAPGMLVLIEKGEKHQLKQAGREPLVLLNFYAPPAYTDDGELRWSLRGMLSV